MTARGKRLLDRPPDEIEALLSDARQLDAHRLITELIGDLRTCGRAKDYYEFQRELGAHIFDAQTRQAEASRSAKRERSRKDTPDARLGTWALELVLWDRIVRQLRSVGDALAWRCFGFDRRIVIALSRNAPPSPVVGKDGLGSELGVMQEAWQNQQQFALLHDLTNSIRIGDVTIVTDNGWQLYEVKTSAAGKGSRRRAQVKRARQALDAIQSGAPLADAGPELVVADSPLKIDIAGLRAVLDRAREDGVASKRVGRQQVMTALAAARPSRHLPVAVTIEQWERLKSRAFSKAELAQSPQHLRGVRSDSLVLDAGLAPFPIFPLAPDVAASLTTDLLAFEYVVGWERVAAALRARGFTVTCPLPEASGLIEEDQEVFWCEAGDLRLTIHKDAVGQLLHELVDVDRYASAIKDIAERAKLRGDHVWSGAMTFSNERAIWR